MRKTSLSGALGGVLFGAAWLTGACGANFVGDMSQAGAGGVPVSSAEHSSSGAPSSAGASHTNEGGSASTDTGAAGHGASASYGSGEAGSAARGGSSNSNNGGSAGSSLSGAGAGDAGASGMAGADAGGAGAGGAGAGGAGAGGGGARGSGGGGSGGDVSCLASSTQAWSGCQAESCGACSSAPALVNHPLYFKNHPSCTPIASCPNSLSACGSACPPPGDSDLCNGTAGQWDGCRGTGCYVCAELVTNYPKYFEHHPYCVKNGTCGGTGYATCNANCPAPAAEDM